MRGLDISTFDILMNLSPGDDLGRRQTSQRLARNYVLNRLNQRDAGDYNTLPGDESSSNARISFIWAVRSLSVS